LLASVPRCGSIARGFAAFYGADAVQMAGGCADSRNPINSDIFFICNGAMNRMDFLDLPQRRLTLPDR
jgi:hypothetical protein